MMKREINQQKLKVQPVKKLMRKPKRGKTFIPKKIIKFIKVTKDMITLLVVMLLLFNNQK